MLSTPMSYASSFPRVLLGPRAAADSILLLLALSVAVAAWNAETPVSSFFPEGHRGLT